LAVNRLPAHAARFKAVFAQSLIGNNCSPELTSLNFIIAFAPLQ
jgi:hypothetical protein